MNHSQQELRCAAAQAFIESLDQLDQRLSPAADSIDTSSDRVGSSLPGTNPSTAQPPPPSSRSISVHELEAAVADIEQFTRARDLRARDL